MNNVILSSYYLDQIVVDIDQISALRIKTAL